MKIKKFVNHQGLTVIEIVIGLGIAVALMALMVQTYVVTMRLSEKGIQRVEQLEETQIVLEQIVRDLRRIIPSSHSGGKSSFILHKSRDTIGSENYLEFSAFIQGIDFTDPYDSTIERVTYSLNKNKRIIRLSQIMDSSSSSETELSSKSRPLGVGLRDTEYQIEITCLDSSTTSSGWVSEWLDRNDIPDMIRITVTLSNTFLSENTTQLFRTVRLGGI